jgi:hypothetical protein
MSTQSAVGNVPRTVARITVLYRGQTQQFTTISQALHFLRGDAVKIGWFHKITADVDLVAVGDVRQTQRLRGQKFAMIAALQQLDRATKPPPA